MYEARVTDLLGPVCHMARGGGMVGMKFTDPHKIVTEYLTEYAHKQLGRPGGNKTAEGLAHLLAGMRISRRYRMDIPEGERNFMAREFLRGILTDHAV